MIENRPLELDERGVMKKGVIVRHLILPGELESTREVLEWFARAGKNRAYLSVMSQYTPVKTPDFPDPRPDRYLSEEEYEQVLEWLSLYDLEDGFIQELITGDDWLPDFNESRPFFLGTIQGSLALAGWVFVEEFNLRMVFRSFPEWIYTLS